MALKELEVRYATKRQKDYKLADGEGLYLLVRPNGSKLWRMKYRFDGKEKLLSLGRYPDLSLAEARLRRAEAKVALGQGRDPGARAASAPITTFEAAITSADVLAMVRSVEARGALDVSRRLKQHVSQIYRFAIPQGWAEVDPAAHLSDLLKPKPRVRHMARIGMDELPELVRAIDRYDGEENPKRRAVTRAALLFTLLTWARTNETRLATWDEFEGLDGPEPLWRVPADRMKMEREHLVPLSKQAVAVLTGLGAASRSGFVFTGDKLGQPISQNTMIYGCYRMGYRGRQTVHGFRGIASTWANEAECYRPDWIELALAHAERAEVRGAYNSALYLTPRRRMLGDWGALIVAFVTPTATGEWVADIWHEVA